MAKAKGKTKEAPKKKLGRPVKDGEKRITRSIRVTPTNKDLIEGKHGTIQKWFDECFKNEFGEVHEAKVVRKTEKSQNVKSAEEISVDDF